MVIGSKLKVPNGRLLNKFVRLLWSSHKVINFVTTMGYSLGQNQDFLPCRRESRRPRRRTPKSPWRSRMENYHRKKFIKLWLETKRFSDLWFQNVLRCKYFHKINQYEMFLKFCSVLFVALSTQRCHRQ